MYIVLLLFFIEHFQTELQSPGWIDDFYFPETGRRIMILTFMFFLFFLLLLLSKLTAFCYFHWKFLFLTLLKETRASRCCFCCCFPSSSSSSLLRRSTVTLLIGGLDHRCDTNRRSHRPAPQHPRRKILLSFIYGGLLSTCTSMTQILWAVAGLLRHLLRWNPEENFCFLIKTLPSAPFFAFPRRLKNVLWEQVWRLFFLLLRKHVVGLSTVVQNQPRIHSWIRNICSNNKQYICTLRTRLYLTYIALDHVLTTEKYSCVCLHVSRKGYAAYIPFYY